MTNNSQSLREVDVVYDRLGAPYMNLDVFPSWRQGSLLSLGTEGHCLSHDKTIYHLSFGLLDD